MCKTSLFSIQDMGFSIAGDRPNKQNLKIFPLTENYVPKENSICKGQLNFCGCKVQMQILQRLNKSWKIIVQNLVITTTDTAEAMLVN